jgi:hypothetical protein
MRADRPTWASIGAMDNGRSYERSPPQHRGLGHDFDFDYI